MDIKRATLLVLSIALWASASARADDDDEHHYRKGKRHREVHHHHHHYQGCPPPTARGREQRLAEAPRFPRESAGEGASARERQREILLKELATEEQLLERARRQPAHREAIEQHQRNVDALRRELGSALR